MREREVRRLRAPRLSSHRPLGTKDLDSITSVLSGVRHVRRVRSRALTLSQNGVPLPKERVDALG